MRFVKCLDVQESAVVCEESRDLPLQVRCVYGTGSVTACMLCTKEW